MPKGIRGRVRCSFPGCVENVDGNGYCKLHNARFKRHGDPSVVKTPTRLVRPYAVRFWEKVDRDGPIPAHAPHLGPCWVWMAAVDGWGYGLFARVENRLRTRGAHIIAFNLMVGPVPEGLELDHLCRNPSCVNPAHLEPVTHAENMRRAAAAGRMHNANKTHCPKGHAYDEANTKWTKDGRRDCRECARRRSLDWYYRNSDPTYRSGRKR